MALGLSKLLRGKAEARQVQPPIETKPIDGKAIAAQARPDQRWLVVVVPILGGARRDQEIHS